MLQKAAYSASYLIARLLQTMNAKRKRNMKGCSLYALPRPEAN